MAVIKTDAPSMSEVLCGVRLRKAQNTFLNPIDTMADWRPIRTFTNKKYLKRANAAGLNPSKQLFNRIVSRYRYAIERIFGGIR